MRPRLFTVRNILLLFIAAGIFGGLAFWVNRGMPLPGYEVPSTAGKIAFISDRGGSTDLWMMDTDGSNAVQMTHDKATERSPAWSRNGSQLAFVAEGRADEINPQIYEMQAAPGPSRPKVTRTDSPKESPVFGPDNRLYFLDAGKIGSISAEGTDSAAVLPDPDQRQHHNDLFSMGGFTQAAPLAEDKLVAVMHTERADALVLYDADESQEALYLLGLADHIHVSARKGGGFAAVFSGSQPLPQPFPLYSKATDAGQGDPGLMQTMMVVRNLIIDPDESSGLPVPPRNKAMRFIALFDGQGKGVGGFVLPDFSPDAVFASPDGDHLLLTSENEKTGGLLLVDMQQQAVAKAWDKPAREATWSPNGSQFAFVSGKNIFVAPGDGSTPPKNLTGDKGRNHAPAWSPAIGEAKR